MTGVKRGSDELRQEEESVPKRAKSRDYHSVSKIIKDSCSQVERNGTATVTLSAEFNHVRGQLDLNVEACEENDSNIKAFPSHDRVGYPNGSHKHEQNSRDISECASSSSDPLKVWREMKQNGFGVSSQSNHVLSSSRRYGGVPLPMRREKKPQKNDNIVKKRMELAKKEEVERFKKIAAPSGLLKELNLGIINHVRNGKQVRTIIESLVRSEKLENSHEESGKGSRGYSKVPEESRSVSNNESAEVTNVSCLAFKAASVASQWLELLQLDIEGRLTALRQSKKRARDVITTDLPLLISKSFAISNQEKDPCCNNHIAAMHRAKWTELFVQMDRALSQEQMQLERWLNQLNEMKLHCDQGLQHSKRMPAYYRRTPDADDFEKELAVRAAAASIYSACNFVVSKENLPCF